MELDIYYHIFYFWTSNILNTFRGKQIIFTFIAAKYFGPIFLSSTVNNV